jgi:hypothetical protein
MERGLVDIMGVTTRTNNKAERRCAAHPDEVIELGQPYERVMRLDGQVESYSPQCFASEFGKRELYGD